MCEHTFDLVEPIHLSVMRKSWVAEKLERYFKLTRQLVFELSDLVKAGMLVDGPVEVLFEGDRLAAHIQNYMDHAEVKIISVSFYKPKRPSRDKRTSKFASFRYTKRGIRESIALVSGENVFEKKEDSTNAGIGGPMMSPGERSESIEWKNSESRFRSSMDKLYNRFVAKNVKECGLVLIEGKLSGAADVSNYASSGALLWHVISQFAEPAALLPIVTCCPTVIWHPFSCVPAPHLSRPDERSGSFSAAAMSDECQMPAPGIGDGAVMRVARRWHEECAVFEHGSPWRDRADEPFDNRIARNTMAGAGQTSRRPSRRAPPVQT